ncbi:hypothetical protein PGQ11_001523 [Apiospora arundinis]|uniref:Uncharacterized protein n=1 Tax=Apiospora arundinis TaxID=335852 RepID=A0ABR2JN35_9PEZI
MARTHDPSYDTHPTTAAARIDPGGMPRPVGLRLKIHTTAARPHQNTPEIMIDVAKRISGEG